MRNELNVCTTEMKFEVIEFARLMPKEYFHKRYIIAINENDKIVAVYSVENVKWFKAGKKHFIQEVENEGKILWQEYDEEGNICRIYEFA